MMSELNFKIIGLCCFAFLIGSGQSASGTKSINESNTLGLINNIVHVYHGLALDAKFREIDINRAAVEFSINKIIEKYEVRNNSKDLLNINQAIKIAKSNSESDINTLLLLNGAKAEFLLRSQKNDVDDLISKLGYMRDG